MSDQVADILCEIRDASGGQRPYFDTIERVLKEHIANLEAKLQESQAALAEEKEAHAVTLQVMANAIAERDAEQAAHAELVGRLQEQLVRDGIAFEEELAAHAQTRRERDDYAQLIDTDKAVSLRSLDAEQVDLEAIIKLKDERRLQAEQIARWQDALGRIARASDDLASRKIAATALATQPAEPPSETAVPGEYGDYERLDAIHTEEGLFVHMGPDGWVEVSVVEEDEPAEPPSEHRITSVNRYGEGVGTPICTACNEVWPCKASLRADPSAATRDAESQS